MASSNQLSYGDGLLSSRRKWCKLACHLSELDLLIDRRSFLKFVGIHMDQEIPCLKTFWRFKEALVEEDLDQQIFERVPEGLAEDPSTQIVTDARLTKKRGRWYFGYKGPVGVDMESKRIRRICFTPAHLHDSIQTETLVSCDEGALFGDKAYFDSHHKYSARKFGWFYGVLEKPDRRESFSAGQKKHNRKLSRIRTEVEHPFAWMKTIAGLTVVWAKNQGRNRLRFLLTCSLWNLSWSAFLLRKSKPMGLVAP